MHKNIRLAYVITTLSELYLPSVPALFFYLQYFDFAQIATFWAIQVAATNIFEVPTGAFADMVGRRTSIILSFMIGALSLAIFPFTQAFGVFVILEIAKGLASALYSGSMEALTYDSLKQEKKEEEYDKVAANIETVNWSSWAISSLLGGYLYYWQFRSPWIIQAIMFAGAAILSYQLVEPRIDSVKVSWQRAVRQNMEGFRELFASIRTARITLQLALIGAGYIIASNILGASQVREYGMDARGTGWVFAMGCLASVVASRYFARLKNYLGERRLIVGASSLMLLSFLLAKYVGVVAGIALILMRIASSSTFRNTRSVVVNKWITSRNRATALSSLNLLTQVPYVLAAPLLGLVVDSSSPNQFAWYLGIILILLVGLSQMLLSGRIFAKLRG